MPRRRKLLWVASGVLGFFAVVLVAAALLLDRVLTPDLVAQRASALLGEPVRVEAVGVHLHPTLAIVLEGVSIGDAIAIGSAEVDLADGALLRGRVQPDEVEIERLRLQLVRDADGRLALVGRGSQDEDAPAAGFRLPPRLRFEVREAEVEWLDRTLRDVPPVVVHLERLLLERGGENAAVALEGVASLEGHGAGSRVSVRGEVGPWEGGQPLSAQPLALDIEAESLDASWVLPYLPAEWNVHRVTARPDATLRWRGRWSGECEVDVDVAWHDGIVDAEGLVLSGPSRLRAPLRRSHGAASLDGATFQASGANWGPVRARDVHLELDYAGGELAVGLHPGTIGVGALELEDDVRIEGRHTFREGRPHVRDARVRAGSGRLGGLPLDAVDGRFALAADILTVEELRFRVHRGSVVQRGTLHLAQPLGLDFVTSFEGVDPFAFAGITPQPGAEPPRLDGEIALRGQRIVGARYLDPLEGAGHFRLEGGTMPTTGMLSAIGASLAALVPGVARGEGAPAKLTRIQSLRAGVAVSGGRVHTEDLDLRTDDYRARGRGWIDETGRIGFDADVTLSPQGLEKALDLARVARATRKALRLPAIPVRMDGTLSDPQLRVNTRAVPMATLHAVLGVPSRAKNIVKGTAGALGKLVPGRQGEAAPDAP